MGLRQSDAVDGSLAPSAVPAASPAGEVGRGPYDASRIAMRAGNGDPIHILRDLPPLAFGRLPRMGYANPGERSGMDWGSTTVTTDDDADPVEGNATWGA